MKISVVVLLFLLMTTASCNNNDAKNGVTEQENYEITKQRLREKETKRPESFLIVKGTDKHNLLGQTVVKGSITNKATVVIYKDVDVQLDFYSKTGTLLETDKETVYENIRPGEIRNFKTKYFAPKGSDSVALKIVGAKILE